MAGKKHKIKNNENHPSLFFSDAKTGEEWQETSANKPQPHIKTLFVIDANSMIHRAFHALPLSLRNSKGNLVNAAYGFASMLVKIITDFKPDAVIAAFDTKAPTFRHELYKDYKANRPETADELIPQFGLAKKVLNSFDIPIIEIPGFEADDILATIAEKAAELNMEVYIVSGDRDMLQLVSENIKVITTKKGVSEVKIYNIEGVFDRFGVYPHEIPDFLALKGETSDNIPGVPGIGEKTAAQLIRKYGNLENLYEKLEELKGKKFYESLLKNREQVFQARELTRLRRDAPVRLDEIIKEFSYDEDKVSKVFSELEFGSLLKRLSIPEKPIDIELSLNEKSEKTDEKSVISSAFSAKKAFAGVNEEIYISSMNLYASLSSISSIESILDEDVRLATNNLKKLYRRISSQELRAKLKDKALKGLVDDLSILLWLNNPDRKKYDFIDYAGESLWYEYLSDAYKWTEEVRARIVENGMEEVYLNIELPFSFVLAEMEEAGLPVDIEALENLTKELERLIKDEEESIYRLSGTHFNINSPQQLSKVLYEILKIKPAGKRKTHYATDQATLMKLINSHPVVEKILAYRELTKLKRTYVDAFLEKIDRKTHRIYSTFIQTGTATGRITSEDPNLQNLPLKGAFAEEFRRAVRCGHSKVFIAADYANIDLRVLAHLSEDEKLIDAFIKGEDIHTRTALEVLGVSPEKVDDKIRRIAKAINFGIVYGVTPEGLSAQAGISREAAKLYIENYFEKYKGVKTYLDRTIKEAYENGFVTTILGRRRYLPGLKSSNISERNAAERLAMNTPVQGSSADVIKVAMLKLAEALRSNNLNAKIVLQIHDSLLLEVEENQADEIAALLKETMESAVSLKVPLTVNVKAGKDLSAI